MIETNKYELPDNWKTFACSQENLIYAYNKFMQFPILFDDDDRGNFKYFCETLISANTINFLTGDYGLVIIENVVPFRDANIHLCFWDRRFKGRDIECKQTLKWLFDKLSLERVSVSVPETTKATISFILSLGFKKEGVKRRSYKYKNRFLDSILFGLLRDDLFKEE